MHNRSCSPAVMGLENRFSGGDRTRKNTLAFRLSAITLLLGPAFAVAQGTKDGDHNPAAKIREEVTVVGTQIKGAATTEALAVSVFNADTIAALGVESAQDLLALIPENGQNLFNDGENFAGGINAARGDVGVVNLRSLGTGNTLVLLNGRRLVNAASYQTEEVGGSFVPVNSVNSNLIPAGGLTRLEVLRDGASALYGADAVAGVVNTVMQTDFDGLAVSLQYKTFDHVPRNDRKFSLQWGTDFNSGRTQVSTFINYYDRDRVRAADESRWANSDFRPRLPANSPWAEGTDFRNTSPNSLYGQFDVVSGVSSLGLENTITDRSGEFETYPAGSEQCQYDIGYGTCGAVDGQGVYRFNSNDFRDLASGLSRFNFFASVTHELESGVQSFTELLLYESSTQQRNDPETSFSASRLRVGASNYWNPLGPCGSPNRLADEIIGTEVPCEGLALTIDNYRYADAPPTTYNDSETWRMLQGLRGTLGLWDWETAVSLSKAARKDYTPAIPSNTLIQQALLDPTPQAYNPFSGGKNTNIERALVPVRRLNETELKTFDVRISTNNLFEMYAGDAGFAGGFEYREESFLDDRDPRHDGTLQFTDWQGDTYPVVSDIVGSSATADSSGRREVYSVYGELALPLLQTLDAQLALRHEHFSDTSAATVGKLAFGWRPLQPVLVRGSWSESFRVANLITVNEEQFIRSNTRTDWVCEYAADFGGDPEQDELDCSNSTQRSAQGSDALEPEESTNTSVGLVLTPTDSLTITLDYWSIEKQKTIGLIGEENHTLTELVTRIEAGTGNCTNFIGNPALQRASPDPDLEPYYLAAGICPAGELNIVNDTYRNLDTRTLRGHDAGIYYSVETPLGQLGATYNLSVLDKFEQQAGDVLLPLTAAKDAGVLPANYPVEGFANLLGRDGNQKQRESLRLNWSKGAWRASVSGYKVSRFYQSNLTLATDAGAPLRYVLPAMTTWDATLSYSIHLKNQKHRILLGIKNITDERAPLADRYFGFLTDAHNDYGSHYYLNWKVTL